MARDTLLTEWGQRLRETREARGLSQAALARLAEVDQSNLSRIEKGVQGVSDELRMRLAAALGVEVSVIFDYGRRAS